MNTPSEEPTLHELLSRVAALEQANGRLQEELTSLGAERVAAEGQTNGQTRTRTSKSSRRKVLEKGLGVAVATVGAGALLELSGGTVQASSIKPGVFASSTAGTPAVKATGTNGADGVDASSDSGIGVHGVGGSVGVEGNSTSGDGVFGSSGTGTGVFGSSSTGLAGHFVGNVKMDNNLTVTDALSTGTLSSGAGTFASSISTTTAAAVSATGTNGADGVDATSDSGFGVVGTSGAVGVEGNSTSGFGVVGNSTSGTGVTGHSDSGDGVFGSTSSGNAIHGFLSTGGTGLAGLFEGNVTVTGTLSKGGGSFKIDHPLDPAHKYLSHSFVESPDMKNIYDGVVTLNANGEAEVRLSTWFDTLNTDFRYQLTCLGGYAPVYIAEKIRGNRFRIAGGLAGMEVSWMVTGIRQDPWANAYRIPVEEDKPESEQGSYLHPELYGQPEQPRAGVLL